jgi:gamma-glutamyltranspeptidase/glutathione hydrolase
VLKTRISDAYGWMSEDPVASAIYLPDGLLPETGTILVQSDLANSLELIAQNGAKVFYRGEIALAISDATNGFLSYSDLQRYAAVIRTPVLSEYRGYEVIGTPPNVAGITVAEALNILEYFDLSQYTWSDAQAVHIIAEALKLASADRLPYDADPDFFDVPLDELLSVEYAGARAGLIRLDSAMMPTNSVPAGNPYFVFLLQSYVPVDEIYSASTTQLSILDKDGNAVSITQTLSDFWGSRVMVPGYGFFINDELHNFNDYNPNNLADVNVHEPFKRPRTVIAPTIIRDPAGEVFMVVGTPGAGYIPSTVVEMIVNVVDFGMSLEDAIRAPKFCSRVSYKELRLEGGYPQATLDALAALGHTVKADYGELNSTFGGINAILVQDGLMTGVGSFRRDGGAATP